MFETIKGNTGGRTTFDFFFKYSSARREDCKEMENLTDVTAEYLLKYCSTRWLCIGKVVVRMMEPMENIKEYFFTFLPALKEFMNKNGVGCTERYQRIKKALNNDLLFPTLSFIVYTSNIFKLLLSRSKQPLIYILYIWMKKLVGDLLFKFYSIKFLSNIGGSDRLLKISEYIKFNVYAKKKYNTQREVGSKTKELLASIDTLEKKKFKERPVSSFYAEFVKYLLANLPLDNQVLIHVKYLHPSMKSKIGASNSLARLTETVWKCLVTSVQECFEVKLNSSVSELKDKVKLELTAFQLKANVPEVYRKDDAYMKKQWEQPSYWKHAYALAGMEDKPVEDEYKY